MGVLFNIIMSCKILHKDDHTIWKCHMVWYMLICTFVYMSAGIYELHMGNIYCFSYIYYLSWLMVMAYIDYYTGYVYNCMEYAVIIPLIISVLSLYGSCFEYMHIVCLIVPVLVYSVVVGIMSHMGCMGEGDRDVLIFNSVIITVGVIKESCNINSAAYLITEGLFANMMFTTAASVMFIIRNIRYIRLKKLALRERRPFLPSIYMAAVLFFLIKICFTFELI